MIPQKERLENRLIYEKSPYLLQHAHNPVDWYPWGKEAFEKAKKEDKPIFLSIGYSTCHWCHVMAHESFENPDIAKILNQFFVAIKVDREERPDIDHIYMTAVTAMTGQGGWPLSVFLTPDKKPFFGGTYFPPYAKWGSPGFADPASSRSRRNRWDRGSKWPRVCPTPRPRREWPGILPWGKRSGSGFPSGRPGWKKRRRAWERRPASESTGGFG